jgi:hypothetical protein
MKVDRTLLSRPGQHRVLNRKRWRTAHAEPALAVESSNSEHIAITPAPKSLTKLQRRVRRISVHKHKARTPRVGKLAGVATIIEVT